MALTASELARKLVHVGVGGFALLLRFLSWPQAALMALVAFLFNWQVLPRIGGRQLWRHNDHAVGYPLGILLYPLSVLGLVLVFRHELWMAAAVWGILSVGDGMASIAGQALGGPRLPWNTAKGWAGFAACAVFGALAAAFLAVWTLKLPLAALFSARILGWAVPLALFCALVETAPTTLDDNLTVPLAGACLLPLLVDAAPGALLADPDLPRRVGLGLGLNAALALFAWKARSIDRAGAVSAIVIGTLITGGLGLPGLAVMVAFFVVGSAVTRLGYRVKAARGIAQEKGGARGWRNAWANGGVPALLAVLAGMTVGGWLDVWRGILAAAYTAAVATAAADTCSSEIGKAYGRRTFMMTTLRRVPPGTEGAISLEGTVGGLLGGVVVAAVGAATGLYTWLAVPLVAVAGLLGSLAESLIGTWAVKKGWMDNDLLNAVNTAIGAGILFLAVELMP